MEKIEKRMKLFEAKRAQCFERLQSIYKLVSQLKDGNTTIVGQFLMQARMVDQLRTEFIECVDQINLLSLDLNEDYTVDYKSLTSFDDLYYIIKSNLARIDAPVVSARAKQEIPSESLHNFEREFIKIPRIELPTFNGEIHEFPFFYETFKRVIHDNYKLTDSERVHYLFSHLNGKAKSVCAGLVPSAENYSIVWDALIAKYYDTRALATSYLNQLFSIKPLNGPSANNLEKTIDKYSALISALKQLKVPDLSEFIFVYMGLKLLDSDTARSFEMSIRTDVDMPRYEEFIKFVREQVKILYRTSQRPSKSDATPHGSVTTVTSGARGPPAPRVPHTFVSQLDSKCLLCDNKPHALYNCKEFNQLAPMERFKFIKENNFCVNCLSIYHNSFKCKSISTCRKCKNQHHTLLHFGNKPPSNPQTQASTSAVAAVPNETVSGSNANASLCTMSSISPSPTSITEVLATAKVCAVGRHGKDVHIRCLLDPGSQKHYVTEGCCRKLGLSITRDSLMSVKGIGGTTKPVKGKVNLKFSSRFKSGNYYTIEALVLDEITSLLPTCQIDNTTMNIFSDIPLADDTWGTPGRIDLLLGVKLFAEMLLPGKIVNTPGLPDALETVLGFVILGDAPTFNNHNAPPSLSFCSTYDVEDLVRKFWEVEDLGNAPVFSLDDKQAEEFYRSTVSRCEDGGYEVALPFKCNPFNLGDSYKTAESRFLCLERKFVKQPNLKLLYDEVITDHLNKNYLTHVPVSSNDRSYYIPHHSVLREYKVTTKLRVVLDASAKTDSGLSLNDILHTGPSLQADLFDILINLRLFPVAMSADVRQMYLCIKVRAQDHCYQRILYRFHSDQPLQVYEYNRVAFGLRSSPFLALRTIQQLAKDEGDNFPNAKDIVARDIYMDDLATSVINEPLAVRVADELVGLFKAGGFQLAKWSSNSSEVLRGIPKELRLTQSVAFDDDNATLKILGLRWYPAEDVFNFEVFSDDRPCTKRNILSAVARLFDVLGLVAPIILFAKLLIKELWILKIDWDEVPPSHITRQWIQFQSELPLISNIKFPRHIGVVNGSLLTILAFADASEKAYGAAVYAYVSTLNHNSFHLICAKSKVAPIKIISLARLELCASHLLSKLVRKVIDNYAARYKIDSVFAFSDSTVVLSWIHSSPHRWHTFVANRVAKIQENISSEHFYHIKGSENPSDCLSRGLTPAQLADHPLWLCGPPWISLPRNEWPIKPFVYEDKEIPEEKNITLTTNIPVMDNIFYDLSHGFSSWNKYIRSAAYILKFIKKLPRGHICASDLISAEQELLRALQTKYFASELRNIKENKKLSLSLQKLKCFLDEDGLLRVGGRLQNSIEGYNYKHPVLLPRRDHVIDILIDHHHQKHFHAGPETLMSLLRQNYWILSARSIIRQRIFKCNACFRVKPRATSPIMADLPSTRVTQVDKPFTHTGCDYAGPIYYRPSRRRGIQGLKTYICLFTCMTTRAVHIELAADLSTASFLSAFKRFLSRRGPVQCVYSDNGTNLVGAKSYLQELYSFLANEYNEYWQRELSERRINWKLIPPNSPHFGGCWESQIKCIKTHLYRSIGSHILLYDELETVLAQIEALLNSRPLCVLSSDPSEPTALTPAHFLNVSPLSHLPAAPITETRDHLIQKHEFLDKIVQSFWSRWRNDYLHTLQCRQKWNTPSQPVVEGTVVVVMQDNIMPLHWPLGLITQNFKGKDGVIRVALVKTKFGVYKRPVVKLCPLGVQ